MKEWRIEMTSSADVSLERNVVSDPGPRVTQQVRQPQAVYTSFDIVTDISDWRRKRRKNSSWFVFQKLLLLRILKLLKTFKNFSLMSVAMPKQCKLVKN